MNTNKAFKASVFCWFPLAWALQISVEKLQAYQLLRYFVQKTDTGIKAKCVTKQTGLLLSDTDPKGKG